MTTSVRSSTQTLSAMCEYYLYIVKLLFGLFSRDNFPPFRAGCTRRPSQITASVLFIRAGRRWTRASSRRYARCTQRALNNLLAAIRSVDPVSAIQSRCAVL